MSGEMRKIGILGGTFNPIHTGHLLLAEYALDAGLSEIWFIPTGQSYMKDEKTVLPGEDRLKMVELAVADNPRFSCLDLEIRREGDTYTCETLEQLKAMYPEDEFYFLAGTDCLDTIHTWKGPERIFACCTLLVALRGETPKEWMEQKKQALEAAFGARIQWLPFLRLSISSTEVRERVNCGKSIRYLTPDKVVYYIEEKGFYREKGNRRCGTDA